MLTVTAQVAVLPSVAVAVIVAVPTATAVTRPLSLTTATLFALLVHFAVTPVESAGDRVSCCVLPGAKVTVAGAIERVCVLFVNVTVIVAGAAVSIKETGLLVLLLSVF